MKEVYPKSLLNNTKNRPRNGAQKLCTTLDSLPGIETFCSSGDANQGISIWFKVKTSKQGLFFLTRCVDNRYWKYGDIWKLELTVGDMNDGQLPIHYHLHSGSIKGREAYRQAHSLIDNMNYHLNHKNFIKGFGLNIDKFKQMDTVMIDREEKLKKIIKKTKKI
jgi:hypothetical protein